jgi:signal peptidase I
METRMASEQHPTPDPADSLQPSDGAPPDGFSHLSSELLMWVKTMASAAVYAAFIVAFVGQVARVEGFSMTPTLDNRDRLVVNKLAYRWHKPAVGDIVMVASPHEPDKMLVKRVIAGPSDVVRSVAGRIYRNDLPLPDDFVATQSRSLDDWGPEVVPPGHYFVMGDHRNNSLDSRKFGPVPEKYIAGKVQLRWWPIDHRRLF